jgi:hypothetical protein
MLKAKLYILMLLLLLVGCDQVISDYRALHNKNHVITCKHPLGHILKYEVDAVESRYPYSSRAGVWRFKTIKGLEIISTYCHLEINKGELV